MCCRLPASCHATHAVFHRPNVCRICFKADADQRCIFSFIRAARGERERKRVNVAPDDATLPLKRIAVAASSEVFVMGFSIGLGVLGIGAPYACIAFLALVMNKGGEDRKWANGATRNRGLNWNFRYRLCRGPHPLSRTKRRNRQNKKSFEKD